MEPTEKQFPDIYRKGNAADDNRLFERALSHRADEDMRHNVSKFDDPERGLAKTDQTNMAQKGMWNNSVKDSVDVNLRGEKRPDVQEKAQNAISERQYEYRTKTGRYAK
jgi:hypothetical protein